MDVSVRGNAQSSSDGKGYDGGSQFLLQIFISLMVWDAAALVNWEFFYL